MIKLSADIGFDIVKFQLFKIDKLFAKEILDKSKDHRKRKKWELNEKHIPTYVDLSYVYTKLGEYKKTEDIITKGLSLESNNLPLRLNLSFAFLAV